jgi:hypothetical protein
MASIRHLKTSVFFCWLRKRLLATHKVPQTVFTLRLIPEKIEITMKCASCNVRLVMTISSIHRLRLVYGLKPSIEIIDKGHGRKYSPFDTWSAMQYIDPKTHLRVAVTLWCMINSQSQYLCIWFKHWCPPALLFNSYTSICIITGVVHHYIGLYSCRWQWYLSACQVRASLFLQN